MNPEGEGGTWFWHCQGFLKLGRILNDGWFSRLTTFIYCLTHWFFLFFAWSISWIVHEHTISVLIAHQSIFCVHAYTSILTTNASFCTTKIVVLQKSWGDCAFSSEAYARRTAHTHLVGDPGRTYGAYAWAQRRSPPARSTWFHRAISGWASKMWSTSPNAVGCTPVMSTPVGNGEICWSIGHD